MPALRIRLVAGRGLPSAIIRAGQLGFPWTHAEAVLPDGYLGARVTDGVQIRPVGYDAGRFTAERIVPIYATATQSAAFAGFLRNQVGRAYDRRAIVDFVLAAVGVPLRVAPPGGWRERDSWECAELQLAALINAGLVDGALFADQRHVTPRDLAILLFSLSRPASLLPVA